MTMSGRSGRFHCMSTDKYCPTCFKRFSEDASVCPDDGTPLVGSGETNLVGKVLDNRYTILDRVGGGGMGVVYRARQHVINRIVALKALRRDIVRDESAVKRFLTEARAIASLKSMHTVTLYDFGVSADGLLYYTMELLEGNTLTSLIAREAPLDYERTTRLIVQACASLAEAHKKGILHRDLKPDNLFVEVEDGREILRILDFGIAKLMDDKSMGTITQSGMICGTPMYLSPEQISGKPAVPASDLYSLALVYYETLAGSPPFKADTMLGLLRAHTQEKPPLLKERNPRISVPETLESFFHTALAKDPAARFQSASQFVKAMIDATGVGAVAEFTQMMPRPDTVVPGSGETIPGDTDPYCEDEEVSKEAHKTDENVDPFVETVHSDRIDPSEIRPLKSQVLKEEAKEQDPARSDQSAVEPMHQTTLPGPLIASRTSGRWQRLALTGLSVAVLVLLALVF